MINHQSELIDMYWCQWRTSYWMVQQTQVQCPCYWSPLCAHEHVQTLPEALAAAAAARPSPGPCLLLQCSPQLVGNPSWSRPSTGGTSAAVQSCQTERSPTGRNPEEQRRLLETKCINKVSTDFTHKAQFLHHEEFVKKLHYFFSQRKALILTVSLAGFGGWEAWSISICKACLLSFDKPKHTSLIKQTYQPIYRVIWKKTVVAFLPRVRRDGPFIKYLNYSQETFSLSR